MRGMVARGATYDRTPVFNATKVQSIRFIGGYDTETSPLDLKEGFAIKAQNYEALLKPGYRRIGGYERYDGQTSPSLALYVVLPASITGVFTAGMILTGATSGATGTIAYEDTTDHFVLTKVTGDFMNGESLQIAGLTIAAATDTQIQGGASSPLLDAQYANAAADVYRSDIAAVPGSGDILGVNWYDDVLYAWRNNAGGTAAAMYKSTTSGWAAVALGRELSFTSGGTTEITEGQTITGATSAATAVVTRVMLESGSWAAGDAAGRLIFASQTGTFQAENIDVGVSTNLATIAGNSSAITLSPNGRYEFQNRDFGEGLRMYGVDGVNRGFEFDGTVYCPIATQASADSPRFVREHKGYLVYAYDRTFQISGLYKPYQWTALTGASEIAMSDRITGIANLPGSEGTSGALLVSCRNRLGILYGSDSFDWDLIYYDEVGALPHSIQNIGMTLMMDDRGVTSLQTSTNYGNFSYATLSQRIQTFINAEKRKTVASSISREKSQYRVYFNDGYALYVTFDGRKVIGMMPIFFPNPVTCTVSAEQNNGTEISFFGSSNGYVYQLERGTSFDGADIEAWLDIALTSAGTPLQLKRYKSGILEMAGEGYTEIKFSAALAYGAVETPQLEERNFSQALSAISFWDALGAIWDVGIWDAQSRAPVYVKLLGTGENISLKIYSKSDYFAPLTLSGALLTYSMRRRLR